MQVDPAVRAPRTLFSGQRRGWRRRIREGSLLDDEGDDLEDEEREQLHDGMEESEAQLQAGQVIPAEETPAALRPKR
ncbi:MAG: hypothetical protein U1E65_00460 [Myxococcota bacterium]